MRRSRARQQCPASSTGVGDLGGFTDHAAVRAPNDRFRIEVGWSGRILRYVCVLNRAPAAIKRAARFTAAS
jgi:hypothetical protein